MKPDWDKLMKEFEGSSSVLVADVDCTAGGQGKCQEVGVRGYPTIKYGDPNDLQDYNGGRSFAELQKFAQSLGPTCGPANLDLCDDEKKKLIDEYMALDSTKLESMIKEKEAEIEKLGRLQDFCGGSAEEVSGKQRQERQGCGSGEELRFGPSEGSECLPEESQGRALSCVQTMERPAQSRTFENDPSFASLVTKGRCCTSSFLFVLFKQCHNHILRII